jgi:hypothetical protein
MDDMSAPRWRYTHDYLSEVFGVLLPARRRCAGDR